MSKRKKQHENKKLRREIEILKAQLNKEEKNDPTPKVMGKSYTAIEIDSKLIEKDIKKTIALSAIAFSIIIATYIAKTQLGVEF